MEEGSQGELGHCDVQSAEFVERAERNSRAMWSKQDENLLKDVLVWCQIQELTEHIDRLSRKMPRKDKYSKVHR